MVVRNFAEKILAVAGRAVNKIAVLVLALGTLYPAEILVCGCY